MMNTKKKLYSNTSLKSCLTIENVCGLRKITDNKLWVFTHINIDREVQITKLKRGKKTKIDLNYRLLNFMAEIINLK